MDTNTPRKKWPAIVAFTLAVPSGALLWSATAGATNNPGDEETACFELSPEDVGAMNADEDALAAYLKSKGISHTMTEDGDGLRWVEWDYEDDAANDAVDAFFAERYPLTAEEIRDINADEHALAAYLKAHGVASTVEQNVDGTHATVWDEDDDAANAAVDAFYEERYPAEEGEEGELVEIDAELDSVNC
jgi:hypothetical protein